MKSYPLALPEELLNEIRATAGRTHLSLAETMRQSIRLGRLELERQLVPQKPADILEGLKPLTDAEIAEMMLPDPEMDALFAHLTTLPVPPPSEDL